MAESAKKPAARKPAAKLAAKKPAAQAQASKKPAVKKPAAKKPAATSDAQLKAELAALRAENAKLRTAKTEVVTPVRTHWGRRIVAFVMVFLGLVLAPSAVAGAWAKNQLTSTEAFVETFAPLAERPAVQRYISNQVSIAIIDAIDVDTVTAQVFDGLEELGLPDAAASALGLLEGPANEGIKSLINESVNRIVTSDVFVKALQDSLELTHEQFIALIQGDPSSALQLSDDGTLSLNLEPIVAQVKAELLAQGVGIAEMIPSVNLTVPLVQNDSLALLRPAYAVSVSVGYWLPIASLVLLIGGVLVSTRRVETLFNTSLALAIVMAVFASGFEIARLIYLATVSPSILPTGAAEAIWEQLTERMASTTLAIAAAAAIVALVTWFTGLASGTRARALVSGGLDKLRTWAEGEGVSTGGFGEGLWRARVWVRLGIAALVAIVMFTARPITLPLVIWTAVGGLILLLVAELLSRPQATK